MSSLKEMRIGEMQKSKFRRQSLATEIIRLSVLGQPKTRSAKLVQRQTRSKNLRQAKGRERRSMAKRVIRIPFVQCRFFYIQKSYALHIVAFTWRSHVMRFIMGSLFYFKDTISPAILG